MISLYEQAELFSQSKSKLLSRLKDYKSCLKDEYKKDFKQYMYDYDKKRLIGGKYIIQWVNEGVNSIGKCYLYEKGGVNCFEEN